MKIRAEINEIKNGKTIEKVNAMKSWFFETKLITFQLHLKEKQRDWEKERGRERRRKEKQSVKSEMKEGISLQQVQTLKGL